MRRAIISATIVAVISVGCSTSATPTPAAGTPAAATPAPGSASAAPPATPATPATVPPATPAATPVAASFATPEEAISAYLAGVRDGNVAAILAAAAIDEKAAGFRFDLQVDRLKALLPMQFMAPTGDPFYVEMNRAQETSRVLGHARMLAWSLLTEIKLDGSTIAPADKVFAQEFMADVAPARLAGLKVESIRVSMPYQLESARFRKNAAAVSAVWSADDLTERLALVSLDGTLYLVGFTLLRYGETWTISEQVANLAGTSALGTAKRTTRQEFESLTSGQ